MKAERLVPADRDWLLVKNESVPDVEFTKFTAPLRLTCGLFIEMRTSNVKLFAAVGLEKVAEPPREMFVIAKRELGLVTAPQKNVPDAGGFTID